MAHRDSLTASKAVAPVRTGKVEVVLAVMPNADGVNLYESRYTFDHLGPEGEIIEVRTGPLLDKLPAQAQAQVKAFLDGMWTRAQGTI